MTTQISIDFIAASDFFSRPLALPEEYCCVEEQLASEMSSSLPVKAQSQPLPEVAPDDFEKLYGWFIS